MSDAETDNANAEREVRIGRIFDCALTEALNRLDAITPEERSDNMAFDRAARTALAFLRIAEAAASLHARKRKETTDHEEGVTVRLPDDDDIDRIERQLHRQFARSAGAATEHAAEAGDRQSAAVPGGAEGGVA